MSKRVLFMGGPLFQVPVVKKAKEMGLHVGVVDINDDAPAFAYADEKFVCSIKDFDEALRAAREFRPDGIMPGACDTGTVTAARLCKTLGLQGNKVESAVMASDKVEMLKAFERGGVSHPRFQVFSRDMISDLSSSLESTVGYPAVSKPIDSAGGRGVNYIERASELREMLLSSSGYGSSGDVLLEEYMDGPEVSVEVMVAEGRPYVLQITDKLTSGAPYFFETGHSQPTRIDSPDREAIAKLASDAALAVGLVNSPAHVEIKLTSAGPKMVELGARLGGDFITSYLIDASVEGVCMMEEAIKMALGESVNIGSYSNSGAYSAVKFIPSSAGVVSSIKGIEEARRVPGVCEVEVICNKGDEYLVARDDSSRFGFVFAVADSLDEVMAACETAVGLVQINLE